MGTLAVNYYLKALDNYPFELKEVIESLDYALSYDDEFADAHCLMGRVQMEYMMNMNEAQYHFDRALIADIQNIQTYYSYLNLCMLTGDFQRAERLLLSARKIKGINQSILYYKEALIFEKQNQFKKSKKCMNKAIEVSLRTCDIDFFKSEKRRVDEKLKKSKPKPSKRPTKKKKKKKK